MTSKTFVFLLGLTLIASLHSAADADILLVNADGSGPYSTIQAAVSAAVDGDEVSLTPGTYSGKGNRDIDFQGKAIKVKSQSGLPADTIIDVSAEWMLVTRAFILDSGEGPTSIIEGLTILGGFDDSWDTPSGIVRCVGSSPTIYNCLFTFNVGTCIASEGGAPYVFRCTFYDNYTATHWGAGINSGGPILIEECTFENNRASEDSGGACAIFGGQLRRCTFVENYAYHGGGALVIGSDTLVEDCTFTRDGEDTYGGGAIWSNGGTIRGCLFRQNSGSKGACIYVTGPSTISHCTFVDYYESYAGEAIRAESDLTISNSIIAFGGDHSPCEGCGAIVGTADITCTNIFGNSAGDWTGDIAGQLGLGGNLSADPLFCDVAVGDFTLYSNSPCSPSFSNGCGLIGKEPVACGSVSVDSELEAQSWGKIKGTYR